LKELNNYVNWLPGDEPALTDAQLDLAFYNGMGSLILQAQQANFAKGISFTKDIRYLKLIPVSLSWIYPCNIIPSNWMNPV
jgi:hypothetical protein